MVCKEDEKEYGKILNILINVLKSPVIKRPLSVSQLNEIFTSRLQTRFAITETFMTKFQDLFRFYVLGDDVKIELMNSNYELEHYNTSKGYETGKESLKFLNVIEKDDAKLDKIKIDFKDDMLFDEFKGRFSSRKFNAGLRFILRNSHFFKLYVKEDKTYISVRCDGDCDSTDHNENLDKFIKEEKLEDLLVKLVVSLCKKLTTPLTICSFQNSYNFGSIIVDDAFVRSHTDHFDIIAYNKDGIIKHKEDEKKEIKDENNVSSDFSDEVLHIKDNISSKKSLIIFGQNEQRESVIINLTNEVKVKRKILLGMRDSIDQMLRTLEN